MRVKSVKRVTLEEPVPVYDLTVEGPENFKLENGPFIHNSKDCADALAGVVYGLTMRRGTWASFGIPLTQIPQSVKDVLNKEKEDAA